MNEAYELIENIVYQARSFRNDEGSNAFIEKAADVLSQALFAGEMSYTEGHYDDDDRVIDDEYRQEQWDELNKLSVDLAFLAEKHFGMDVAA